LTEKLIQYHPTKAFFILQKNLVAGINFYQQHIELSNNNESKLFVLWIRGY